MRKTHSIYAQGQLTDVVHLLLHNHLNMPQGLWVQVLRRRHKMEQYAQFLGKSSLNRQAVLCYFRKSHVKLNKCSQSQSHSLIFIP